MLLDVYGHFMPTETHGYADALTHPNGPYTALAQEGATDGVTGTLVRLPNSKANPGADGRTRTADLLITNQPRPPE